MPGSFTAGLSGTAIAGPLHDLGRLPALRELHYEGAHVQVVAHQGFEALDFVSVSGSSTNGHART